MGCGIATKCIYGDGKTFEGDKTGAISFPIYQTATMPTLRQAKAQDLTTAVCRTLQGSRWRMWWLLWKAA